ncbi:unnamed protein product [Paramecium sonneborni]|uniref:Uncharacterized protein n=1 Tax=Paramecium sonneborni TaxID=65129 RepID=A0A8S1LS23_9CILI|nr:unnamed protein product [Paramecium sonneborni]
MGCLESRKAANDSQIHKQQEDVYQCDKGVGFKQICETLQDSHPEAPQKENTFEPSISIDESDDHHVDEQMNAIDNQIFQRRKFLLNKDINPKIIKKKNKKLESPKLQQKNKLDHFGDIKPYNSLRIIQDQGLSQNMIYYYKYEVINKNRIKNIIQEAEKNSQQSIDDQRITNMTPQASNRQSRKSSSISCSSILQEKTFICFQCQKQNQNIMYQLDCLHQFDQNCLFQLITQQINQKKPQIYCLCKKVIRTKIIRSFLEDQEYTDENNQSKMYLENYFENQYNFLANQN